MNISQVKKSLTKVSVVFLWLLLSQASYAQSYSFRSWNYPDRYIRHREYLGFIEPIADDDEVGRKDATFRSVPGLAGKCTSFESVNFPNYFLRHGNFRLHLSKGIDDRGFKQDATFCQVPGLANSLGKSFESVNYPGYYICHSNFELWLHQPDGTQLFKEDATFVISDPLWNS